MNYLIDELLNGNAFTLKKEPEVSVVGIIEVHSAIMQCLAIIHHDLQLWSLIGLCFGTILLDITPYYDIAPYDRIAAGAGKETPQIRGFRQAAVLQVPFAA